MLEKINKESDPDTLRNRLKVAITAFSRNPNDTVFNSILLLIEEAKHWGYDLNVNDSKTKYTLVHFSVTKTTLGNESQMMRLLQLLLAHGVDINKSSTDQGEFTPLHTAARRGLPNIVEWLLDNGANKNIKDKKQGEPYQTALDYVNSSLKIGHDDPSTVDRFIQIQSLLTKPSLFQQRGFRTESMKENTVILLVVLSALLGAFILKCFDFIGNLLKSRPPESQMDEEQALPVNNSSAETTASYLVMNRHGLTPPTLERTALNENNQPLIKIEDSNTASLVEIEDHSIAAQEMQSINIPD